MNANAKNSMTVKNLVNKIREAKNFEGLKVALTMAVEATPASNASNAGNTSGNAPVTVLDGGKKKKSSTKSKAKKTKSKSKSKTKSKSKK